MPKPSPPAEPPARLDGRSRDPRRRLDGAIRPPGPALHHHPAAPGPAPPHPAHQVNANADMATHARVAASRPLGTRVPSGWRVQADLAPGASGCPNKGSARTSARTHVQVTAVLSNLTCCAAQSRASQVWLSILRWPLPGPMHIS